MKKQLNIWMIFMISLFISFGDMNAAEHEVDIHGFISQGYIKSSEYNYIVSDSEGGSFQFNEFGINFTSNLTDDIHMGMQLIARDLGDLYNDTVEVDWAYAEYYWNDYLGLSVGKMKYPFGLYNETRDLDMLRTTIFLPSGVYTESLREYTQSIKGVGIFGTIPIGAAGYIDYISRVGKVDIPIDGGVVKVYASSLSPGTVFNTLDFDTMFTGRFKWRTPIDGLALGLMLQSLDSFKAIISNTIVGVDSGGNPIISDNGVLDSKDMSGYVYSIEFTWDRLVLAGEYWVSKWDTYTSFEDVGIIRPKDSRKVGGHYISGAYMVADWFEVGLYYSTLYDDMDDKDGDTYSPDHNAWLKDIALSLRFNINSSWCFKVEGHSMNGTAWLLADNLSSTFPKENWSYYAVKLSYNF